ncbi:hypothetical protein HYV50_01005 [Candidatus Pacearchaeota archaeon]|nr:hypothetical protein [Candidatus Pacearchaeota archaeon]
MNNHREQEKKEIQLLRPFLPKLKNYDNLFKIFEERFPKWTSIYAVQQNLNLVYLEDLERLAESHFLEKQKFLVGEDKDNKQTSEYWFRLSPNGFYI